MAETGYHDNLTEEQKTGLESFCTAVAEEVGKLGFEEQDLKLWGVPVYGLTTADKLDLAQSRILLKFLRAREFKVVEATDMLVKTLKWRKEFNMSSLLTEEFPQALTDLGTIHGRDKKGAPVTYNFYGTISQDDVANHPERFLRWRIQLHERAIALLDFSSPTSAETVTQIHDYTGVGMSIDKRLKATSKQIINIFQEHYPEFLEKKFFLGVPLVMEFMFNVFGGLVSKRTRSKFVMVGKTKSRAALLECIDIDQILEQYGGFAPVKDTLEVTPITTVAIPARKSETIRISVTPSATLQYEFTTYAQDIGFSYGFENPGEEKDTAGPEERLETGKGTIEATGEVFVLRFNNEYSYVTAKQVVYRVRAQKI
ncbi:uncharacterized protein SPPG_06798 [Spizellomyces punctatus DAOM BR117]|uniref:CRAL-TRIO domain-containing protein n=1 Tax=Spizellomyces punctatus (strain DAOM BR117) TaxID=645134 RepID=A0A0L0HAQ7_SPIPD|nr:uncharacterized protein SPPG_06798 [Spizellomyces punctatus DAOM BR117]KNC97803.1 hypothetical protein SPPG_06798 [Spizellomyces punctatus DAOM BR117]|eukprot:XP_016605843.1 hypothetical protein SPPG_06798 [Spizellomyces punctatus DAOM BR117]